MKPNKLIPALTFGLTVSLGFTLPTAEAAKCINNFRLVDCDTMIGNKEHGYETNKHEIIGKVEEGGWVVAWAEDISEIDAINGVVAGGASVLSANPGPFIEWVRQLVIRTAQSVYRDAAVRFPDALLSEVEQLAVGAISAAVRAHDGREGFRQFGNVAVKAGAIKYSGRNYVGDTTVSRTWGLKPYIAIRIM